MSNCTIHLNAIPENRAPGKFLTRFCTERSHVLSLITTTTEEVERLEITAIDHQLIDSEFLFLYIYSGDTGVCLMTRTLGFPKDEATRIALEKLSRVTNKGFYPCAWIASQCPNAVTQVQAA